MAAAASVGASGGEHARQRTEKATRHTGDRHVRAGGKNEGKDKISTNPQITNLGQLRSSERQQNLRQTGKGKLGKKVHKGYKIKT